LRGYQSGAVDYVPVPVVPEILRAKVKVFVELYLKTRDLKRINRELEDRVAERTAELQASHASLKESEERLRLASQAAEFGTYDFRPRTGQFHCSEQMKKLIGWNGEEELTAEKFLGLVNELDRAAVRQALLSSGTGDVKHRLEFRVPCDGGHRWLLDCGRAFYGDESRDLPVRVVGTVLDLTERKQVEERQLILMAELDHRVKNILANVGAIVKLSGRNTGSLPDFVDALDARIQAIAKAHSMLRRDSWAGIDLNTYLSELLAPFISRSSMNIILKGDPIDISPKAAQSLALLFHELATNAVKYGALSVPGGKVVVSWARPIEKNCVRLAWREQGGPPPKETGREGFGTLAIKTVASELGSKVAYGFEPDGMAFSIEGDIGCKSKRSNASQDSLRSYTPQSSCKEGAQPLRLIVVEDELFVGLHVKTELEDAGHKVVELASNLEQGLEFAQKLEFDFALLDIRLGEELSVPIAEIISKRNLPFAFVTGFEDSSVLPGHLRSVPRFTKPYQIDEILAHLATLSISANTPVDNRASAFA
jgi:PAS domain S-box-containing protein